MPTQINGLPAHVLLIHLVIAAVPLAALLVVLHAVWPAARRRLGVVTPIVTLVALVFVPITASAGTWFRDYIFDHDNPDAAWKARIEHHADLAGTLLWFVLPLFAVALALWLLGRRYDYGVLPDRRRDAEPRPSDSGDGPAGSVLTAVRPRAQIGTRTAVPTWANAVIAVVAVAIAVLNVVQLYRIGDAGAQAVWHGSIQ